MLECFSGMYKILHVVTLSIQLSKGEHCKTGIYIIKEFSSDYKLKENKSTDSK